ncbi:MAG TPA: 6-carboxytetrahydropterin synthase [Chthoniobacterales bacterium]|jgi:6-pyruvoyltetrahydropterin/6-carboxytetrahydropterin synthase|nr:6-carboxytetrahydropterin synthase [Chthoniobacterales bacterium]
MLLTVSKRLEFSASRRLFVPRWSESENVAAFGEESRAQHGTGRNYVVYFIFSGRVDPVTGMLINISEIKRRAGEIVDNQFDHKFLNEDNPSFREVVPTAENIARQFFTDVSPLFADVDAKLVAVHLIETPDRSATYYVDSACDANYWFEFSAARQTMSPRLTAAENAKLFGGSTAIHGHNYRSRLSFRKEKGDSSIVQQHDVDLCIQSLRDELDHRFLNEQASLKDRPMTTESLALYLRERIATTLPVHRIRLHERDDFFAEVWPEENVFLGIQARFSAAHRLHVPAFSDQENQELFGKCDNPAGHGHLYLAEATIGGKYDERSGTLYDFVALQQAVKESVEPWKDRHLDLETEDFQKISSTGENIVRALWPKIDNRVNQQLARLRLWETKNNRFTVRRT